MSLMYYLILERLIHRWQNIFSLAFLSKNNYPTNCTYNTNTFSLQRNIRRNCPFLNKYLNFSIYVSK